MFPKGEGKPGEAKHWANDTSPALLLHKLPAHYSNAAHLAQEEEGGQEGDVRKDCTKKCLGVTGFIQGEADEA